MSPNNYTTNGSIVAEQNLNVSSLSSSHRLPAISGTQALQNATESAQGISLGLKGLDRLLRAGNAAQNSGGLSPGHVTEVFGPPGVGKTTFAIQAAVNALRSTKSSSKVVWIDTGSTVLHTRFREILSNHIEREPWESPESLTSALSEKVLLSRLVYFNASTLPRLLTLLLHPTPLFPPPDTSLIIIDDLSNLILASFPRPRKFTLQNGSREQTSRSTMNRRWAAAADIAGAMANLAALRNLSVLVVNQMAMSAKGRRKAILRSSLGTEAWHAAMHARVMLLRDFAPRPRGIGAVRKLKRREERLIRFAEIVKCGGRDGAITTGKMVPFVVEKCGLRELGLEGQSNANVDDSATEPVLAPLHIPLPLTEEVEGRLDEEREKLVPEKLIIEIADSDEDDEIGATSSENDETRLVEDEDLLGDIERDEQTQDG